MSFIRHDLSCPNGHRAASRLYRRSDGPPLCDECSAPTSIAWFSGDGPALNGFGTVRTDGALLSTGDFEKHKRALERQNPGKRVKVTNPSDAQIDSNIDTRRQRVINSRRARGINVEAVADRQVAGLEQKASDLNRGKIASKDVYSDVAAVKNKIQRTINSFKNSA